jgi:hypothetical protein
MTKTKDISKLGKDRIECNKMPRIKQEIMRTETDMIVE